MNPEPGLEPLQLNWSEGQALAVLEALLGLRTVRLGVLPVHVAPLRLALRVAAERTMASTVWRTLLHEGEGWRERDVLRAGMRARGRLWDSALNEGFALRFGPASVHCWLAAAAAAPTRHAHGLEQGWQHAQLSVADALPAGPLYAGDELFFLHAVRQLDRLSLSTADAESLQRAMARRSCLAALAHPQAGLADAELDAHFDRLLRDATLARALECLGPVLTRAWRAALDGLYPLHSTEARVALHRASSLARVLHRWVAALERHRRMDLAGAVLELMVALAGHRMARSGEHLRREAAATPGLVTLDDRARLLAQFQRVFDVHAALWSVREQLAQERYGDDRYEEAQLYLAAAREHLAPVRAQLAALSHALGTTVG